LRLQIYELFAWGQALRNLTFTSIDISGVEQFFLAFDALMRTDDDDDGGNFIPCKAWPMVG